MAEFYRPRSRSGNFKQLNFGDLGLRVFKENQDIIIESLKLQQARSKEYADEFVRGTKGVAQTEQQNRKILQDLETDYWRNRREAVKVRGQREVEALQGKAREYGKEAQFWQTFAPKFSQGLGQVAQGLTDQAMKKQAFDQFQQQLDDPEWQKKTNEVLFGIESWQDKATQEMIRDAVETGKGWEHLEPLLGEYFKSNRYKSPIVGNYLKGRIDLESAALEKWALDNGIEWNEDTIVNIYGLRARELMHHMGVTRSTDGIEFYNKMLAAGSDAAAKYTNLNLVKTTTEKRNQLVQTVNADNSQQNRMLAWVAYQSGVNQDGTRNPTAHSLTSLGNFFKDRATEYRGNRKDFDDDFLNTPLRGAVEEPPRSGKWFIYKDGKKKGGLVKDQWKNQVGTKSINDVLDKAWNDGIKNAKEKEKDNINTKAIVATDQLKADIAEKEKDDNKYIANDEDWNNAIQQLNSNNIKFNGVEGTNNPNTLLRTKLGFRPGKYQISQTEAQFVKAVTIDYDLLEADRLWESLDPSVRKEYGKLRKELLELETAAGGTTDLNNYSKGELERAAGWDKLGGSTPGSIQQMVPLYTQAIKYEYRMLDANNPKYQDSIGHKRRLNDAKEAAKKHLYPKGDNTQDPRTDGLFGLTDIEDSNVAISLGLKREFNYTRTPPNKKSQLSEKELFDSLMSTGGDLNKLLEAHKYDPTGNTKPIVSKAALDDLAESLLGEKTVNLNNPEWANIIDISRVTKESPSTIINKLLETNNYEVRYIPTVFNEDETVNKVGLHELSTLKAGTIDADIRGLRGLNIPLAVELQYARQEYPEAIVDLMNPAVKKSYEDNLIKYNESIEFRKKSDYGLRPVGGN